MLRHELRRDEGLLILTPEAPLDTSDFARVAGEIDPYIKRKGSLRGLMITAGSFPGWTDLGAFVAHLTFVRNHHRNIEKIAIVTDSRLLALAPKIASHFLHPKIRHFAAPDQDAALAWLRENP